MDLTVLLPKRLPRLALLPPRNGRSRTKNVTGIKEKQGCRKKDIKISIFKVNKLFVVFVLDARVESLIVFKRESVVQKLIFKTLSGNGRCI
jgi:hypothetical protein